MSNTDLFNISLSEAGNYVIIRLNQNMNGEIQRTFAEEAIVTAREHNLNRFLADFRGIRNETAPSEHYNHGYHELNEFAMDRNAKVALLVDKGDGSFNVLVTVICNAGYNFRLFTEREQALNWLLG